MTLRHRLLLVYGIVVLLSVATVGVAIFELRHAREVFAALQHWNEIVLSTEKLRGSLGELPAGGAADFAARLITQYTHLAGASEYANVDPAREALNTLNRRFQDWQASPEALRAGQLATVRAALEAYARIVERELASVQADVSEQEVRTMVLPAVVMGLTLLHVIVIGTLLRRWLVQPMEQLNRQVEALGRDQPPDEPLLDTPREMANLAHALDKARRSLGSLRQQLLEAERLTTIGQLAAQLGHNLRNPLASIRAAAQLAARHAQTGGDARTRMEEIVASVDRLNQWIAGLMEVARADPTPTRSLDVVPTLQRVQAAVAPELAAKELTLSVETPADGLVCRHHPATLEHALVAMIVNAIEASPLGGRIVLRAEPVTTDGQASACRISVQDRGAGLPAEAPERIFDFSYSTKQRGMGLGLALARQALQRQGGSAGARNSPGGGATVYVELPVAADGEGESGSGGEGEDRT